MSECQLTVIIGEIWKYDPVQEEKKRKPVERRESSRLQSAAKLLRNLSKNKDMGVGTSSSGGTPSPDKEVVVARETAELDRSHPVYHSEGKGARR